MKVIVSIFIKKNKDLIVKFIGFLVKISLILKGAEIGSGLKCYGFPMISNKGKLIIGNNVTLHSHNASYHANMGSGVKIIVKKGGILKIGDDSRLNGCCIHARENIVIGNNCLIAAGVNILDNNGHSIDPSKRDIPDLPKKIVIGNNVRIGLNTIILKGSEIGDNCVVGCGCVVSQKIDKNNLVKSGAYDLKIEKIYIKN